MTRAISLNRRRGLDLDRLDLHQQDAAVFNSILAKDEEVSYDLTKKRYGFLQVVKGPLELKGEILEASDGRNQRRKIIENKSDERRNRVYLIWRNAFLKTQRIAAQKRYSPRHLIL